MTDEPPVLQITVSPRFLRVVYIAILAANSLLIFVTAASDLGVGFAQHRSVLQFDLKLEGNVAVWYSSTLLLLAGLVALAIAFQSLPEFNPSRSYRVVWVVIALFFIGLSADETGRLHEWAGGVFGDYFGEVPGLTRSSDPDFAWLILLLPLIVCFLGVMRVAIKWLRIHKPSQNLAVAGAICWIGVLLAEFVEAQLRLLSMERSIQGVIEEGLEITGTALFFAAFIEFLRRPILQHQRTLPLRDANGHATETRRTIWPRGVRSKMGS